MVLAVFVVNALPALLPLMAAHRHVWRGAASAQNGKYKYKMAQLWRRQCGGASKTMSMAINEGDILLAVSACRGGGVTAKINRCLAANQQRASARRAVTAASPAAAQLANPAGGESYGVSEKPPHSISAISLCRRRASMQSMAAENGCESIMRKNHRNQRRG